MKLTATQRNHFFGENLLQGITSSLSTVQPLANTMRDALQAAGIQPPGELSALAESFRTNIVDPISPTSGQTTGDAILSFFQETMTKFNLGDKLSPVLNTVAKGGNRTLQRLEGESTFTAIISNPFTWIILIVLIGVIVWFMSR